MTGDKNFIWLDLEMTGLDITKDVILEIATVITDSELNIIAQGPELVIYQPKQLLDAMRDDVKSMHTKSGLLVRVTESDVTVERAQQETLTFFKKYCDPNTALLAGNSVWQDKNFLQKYMPALVDFCYYRILDITAIKEVVARWYPDNPHTEYKKKETHRALQDVHESIEELRHLRKYFFIKN